MGKNKQSLSLGDCKCSEVYVFGTGQPLRAIVACLHGNERCGLVVPPLLKTLRFKGTVKFVIGNPRALEQNIRFVDRDLNSSFPGSKQGDYEMRRAEEILQVLKGCEVVLDLHSTSRSPEPFGVSIGRPSSVKLARHLGLQRLVIMPSGLKQGHSLLDHLPESVPSLSVECGTHDSQLTENAVMGIVGRFLQTEGAQQPQNALETFKVTQILKLPKGALPNLAIKDFKCVNADEPLATRNNKAVLHADTSFYPVLFGEEAYAVKGVLGLAAELM